MQVTNLRKVLIPLETFELKNVDKTGPSYVALSNQIENIYHSINGFATGDFIYSLTNFGAAGHQKSVLGQLHAKSVWYVHIWAISTRKFKPSSTKMPLNFDGSLAKLELITLVKLTTGSYVGPETLLLNIMHLKSGVCK